MRLLLSILLFVFSLSVMWGGTVADRSEYYYICNNGAWKDVMIDKTPAGSATADPREACLVRVVDAGPVSGTLFGQEFHDTPSYYLQEEFGLYWTTDSLSYIKEEACAFIFVDVNGMIVDHVQSRQPYAFVPVYTLGQANPQSLIWTIPPTSSQGKSRLGMGEYRCEWYFHEYEEPHPCVLNILYSELEKRVPYKEAYAFWGSKKVKHGDVLYSIQDDDNFVVGLHLPLLRTEDGGFRYYTLNQNIKGGSVVVFYQDVVQIKNMKMLEDYSRKGQYFLIANVDGRGVLAYEPELDDEHTYVLGAWDVDVADVAQSTYMRPTKVFSGEVTWTIECDDQIEYIYIMNSVTRKYLNLNAAGEIVMSTAHKGIPYLYFDKDGIMSSDDPNGESPYSFGVDLSRPEQPISLMPHSEGTKWYVLAPDSAIATYFSITSNHEQGGVQLLSDGLEYNAGSPIYYSFPIDQSNWRKYFVPIALEGYTPNVTVTVNQQTHVGTINVDYGLDLADGNYYHLHPSVHLSDYSHFYVNNPVSITDSDGDCPLLGLALDDKEYGEWQLEPVGMTASDNEIMIGARFARVATEPGALIKRILPKGSPIYRIRLKDKGYLRFIPESLAGKPLNQMRGASCFNFTNDPGKAEDFIFWDVDQWLSQSTLAAEFGISSHTHSNEYFIIPRSSVGYYNSSSVYSAATQNEYQGFGQLMLSYTDFRGSLEDPTLLGLDCMREFCYPSETPGYYTYMYAYSYPWSFSPVARTMEYEVQITSRVREARLEGGIKYGNKEYHDRDRFVAVDLRSTDLRVKPIAGTQYTVKVVGNIIQLRYIEHHMITDLSQLSESKLYTIRSYVGRGYWAHNKDNAYNSISDPNGVMLVGTYSDDVTHNPYPVNHNTDANLQWNIFPTGRTSDGGIPQFYVAAQGSGRFISSYYSGNANNYSFFGTQQEKSPLYGVGIVPGAIEGTFMFVSEMSDSYLPEINEKTFANVPDRAGYKTWDLLRTNYAYATPDVSYSAGMLNHQGTWGTPDGVLFRYHKNQVLEHNPMALLWCIEESGLYTSTPFYEVTLQGLPGDFCQEELHLQIVQGGHNRPTVYDPIVNGFTRILSPYTHTSVTDAEVICTLSGELSKRYQLSSSIQSERKYTFTFTTISGIEEIEQSPRAEKADYELNGRLVPHTAKGLIIHDGKVILVK